MRRKKLFSWDTLCIKCLCVPWVDWKRMTEITSGRKGESIDEKEGEGEQRKAGMKEMREEG